MGPRASHPTEPVCYTLIKRFWGLHYCSQLVHNLELFLAKDDRLWGSNGQPLTLFTIKVPFLRSSTLWRPRHVDQLSGLFPLLFITVSPLNWKFHYPGWAQTSNSAYQHHDSYRNARADNLIRIGHSLNSQFPIQQALRLCMAAIFCAICSPFL